MRRKPQSVCRKAGRGQVRLRGLGRLSFNFLTSPRNDATSGARERYLDTVEIEGMTHERNRVGKSSRGLAAQIATNNNAGPMPKGWVTLVNCAREKVVKLGSDLGQ